jgi:hypothetical protein
MFLVRNLKLSVLNEDILFFSGKFKLLIIAYLFT